MCSSGALTFLVNDGVGSFPSYEMMLMELGECRPTALDLGGTTRHELLVSAPSSSGYYIFQTCD